MEEEYCLQKVVPTVREGSEWTCLGWSCPNKVAKYYLLCCLKQQFTIQEIVRNLRVHLKKSQRNETAPQLMTLFRKVVSADMVGREERLNRTGLHLTGRAWGERRPSPGCPSEVYKAKAIVVFNFEFIFYNIQTLLQTLCCRKMPIISFQITGGVHNVAVALQSPKIFSLLLVLYPILAIVDT